MINAYDAKSRFLLGGKVRFETECSQCNGKYTTTLSRERKKKHTWCCKSCAITREWKDENYRKSHESALKIAHNTPEAKAAHSKAQLRKWVDPDERDKMEKALQASKTPEWRAKVSQSLKERWLIDPPNCSFGTRHAGWYDKLDGTRAWLRSSYEHRAARAFDEQGVIWEYEKRRFQICVREKETVYVPDFFLPEYDLIVEVKGYFYPDAREKWEAFLAQHSEIKACIWFKEQIIMLENGELQIENQV
ncbi:hypothetical protein HN588_01265 [Candidatus Bathyarchaeota archaeon]|nr:hypothetical protein [Candidatus Bathyarchaeota archaeon]